VRRLAPEVARFSETMGIEVPQSFEMTPAAGPVGTPIEIRVKGLGWRTMESSWVVNWDNNLVGFVSAGTRGSAVARFWSVDRLRAARVTVGGTS
jgi:hypothetical protein